MYPKCVAGLEPVPFNITTHNSEVLRVPANPQGRDFVIGDLHGHYPSLVDLLAQVSFDDSVDRLFSVGDLIDRGPDSLACLQLLQQPWFYAVLGNHEAMCFDAVKILLTTSADSRNAQENLVLQDYVELYEGDWLLHLHAAELLQVAELLATLPVIISVGDAEKLCHIVHGELGQIDGRDILDSDIEAWQSQAIPPTTRQRCLSGRNLINLALSGTEPAMRPGLSQTYCGHSPVRFRLQYASHRFIDSGGCFADGHFTLLQIHTDRIFLSP